MTGLVYPDALIARDLAERQHHRHGRRQHELEPAQLFRDEISARQRLPGHSRQSRGRRQGPFLARPFAEAFLTSQSGSTWSISFASPRPSPADRRRSDRPERFHVVWMQLGVRYDEAAAKARGRGPDRDHGSLSKDRIRPAGWRIVWSGVDSGIVSSKRRKAPKPPAQKRAEVEPELQKRRLRVRDALHPCRRRARSSHRRAHHADLPDRLLCIRRRRSGRVPVQPPQFRPCL